MKTVVNIVGTVLLLSSFVACSGGGSGSNAGAPVGVANVTGLSAQDSQGSCTLGFMKRRSDAKNAQTKWIQHSTPETQEAAVNACLKFEKFSVLTCRINCQIPGKVIQILCPERNGKVVDGSPILNNCKYMEGL